jgi:hypothetical protein
MTLSDTVAPCRCVARTNALASARRPAHGAGMWLRSAPAVVRKLSCQLPTPLAWGYLALAVMVVPQEGHIRPEGYTSPVTCEVSLGTGCRCVLARRLVIRVLTQSVCSRSSQSTGGTFPMSSDVLTFALCAAARASSLCGRLCGCVHADTNAAGPRWRLEKSACAQGKSGVGARPGRGGRGPGA